jgi:transcriptional regulator with XRE-family HTH domain
MRVLRVKRGWSQDRCVHGCGLDRTYMGGIERGERNLALRNIERIASAVGVTISELMSGL